MRHTAIAVALALLSACNPDQCATSHDCNDPTRLPTMRCEAAQCVSLACRADELPQTLLPLSTIFTEAPNAVELHPMGYQSFRLGLHPQQCELSVTATSSNPDVAKAEVADQDLASITARGLGSAVVTFAVISTQLVLTVPVTVQPW